ncbi:MAG: DUF4296 domain-containing protein [Chitinophagaceae bacterium]|nr:DUF4296 domain-containing protein [Chitinophagaceae bacterium]
MRIFTILLLLVLALYGCDRKADLPGDILPPKKMEEIVWDVMVADEYSKDLVQADTAHQMDVKKERSKLYQQVFNLHGTSREAFNKSFKYYSSRPELTKALFDTLTSRANRRSRPIFPALRPELRPALRQELKLVK